MKTKQTAAEWLEKTLAAASDHVDPVALLALAMLRDAKAELESLQEELACYHDCKDCEAGSGWDAIERNFAQGKYK